MPLGMNVNPTTAGPFAFGAVIGWHAYSSYVSAQTRNVKWLGSTMAVLGGSTIAGVLAGIFHKADWFEWYCMGLGVAFFIAAFGGSRLIRSVLDQALARQQPRSDASQDTSADRNRRS